MAIVAMKHLRLLGMESEREALLKTMQDLECVEISHIDGSEEALKTGKIVEGTICYTGDVSNPNETKYTLDYYVKIALELEKLGCHSIAIKDMAALLKPRAAKELVGTLKKELHVPLHLHTHDSTGNGVSTVLMAAEAGVDIVDLAIESMSSMTSQPSMNAVVEALRGTKRDTGLDFEELSELSRYYNRIRSVYHLKVI